MFGLNIKSIKDDCLNYIKTTKEKFDFIFIDPPYNYQGYQQLKELIIKIIIVN